MDTEPDFKCPECGAGIWGNLVAKARERAAMSFTIEPKDGDRLGLRHVGEMMVQMEKLLISMGNDMGLKTTVAVEGLSCDDGKVKIDMLIARHAKKPL